MVGEHPLFCCITAEISASIESVLLREQQISRLWNSLPPAAQQHYLYGLLVKELVATNDIEGIHSTRQEMREALKKSGGSKRKRFHEFSQLYLHLAQQSHFELPSTLSDVRDLYDQLLSQEIQDSDKPDSALFRSKTVEIVDGTKTIHRAPAGESVINEKMLVMLDVLNEDAGNQLVSTLVSHFMLEYIHPFYDGNGRFGRFLLSAAISRLLSQPTALTLSHSLAESKNSYYQAFSITEEPMNRAEVTFFVESMLTSLHNAQFSLIEELEHKHQLFSQLKAQIPDLKCLSEHAQELLLNIGLVHLFGSPRGASLDHLADVTNKNNRTTRKYAAELESAGLIETTSQRPLRFALSESGIAQLIER